MSNDNFFGKLFHGNFIFSQSFCQTTAEGAEEIFVFYISCLMSDLAYEHKLYVPAGCKFIAKVHETGFNVDASRRDRSCAGCTPENMDALAEYMHFTQQFTSNFTKRSRYNALYVSLSFC